jgi:hypothetical protein
MTASIFAFRLINVRHKHINPATRAQSRGTQNADRAEIGDPGADRR